jgi:amino acid transporter
MKFLFLSVLNIVLIAVFLVLLRKRKLLYYQRSGNWWLTWLAIAIITLMDEFTSIFYVPAEAHRFIGPSAIIFIALTSILIRFMSTRFTEIAEILEHHKLIGGGVYSFSYFVLGPIISFVAVGSIMVDYTLTACISSVSAVLNSVSFFPLLSESPYIILVIVLGIIWAIAGLNILGIRENARFTFAIFILAAIIILNLVVSGIISLDQTAIGNLKNSGRHVVSLFSSGSLFGSFNNFISHIAFCILAYSGIESVIQTAGFVENWKDIRKAYLFLALTVGIITPLVAALALSAPINLNAHEGDLITYYASIVNGIPFGVIVAGLASLTLIMAINTAFVASSELLERVAQRYRFHWLIATNKRQSLYRIHIMNATFFSLVILITSGRQSILADMYALGLIASFCINMGSLLIYRYFMGTKEIIPYYTRRLWTLVIFVILVSCFIFLAIKKPHGTILWATVTGGVVIAGSIIARRRGPEIKELRQADQEMDMIFFLMKSEQNELHINFQRPREEALTVLKDNEVFVTFFSPRQGIPEKMTPNHFRYPLSRGGVFMHMVALLKVVEYEIPHRHLIVHFGWPLSSWLDRFSIGVMTYHLMKLPRIFPKFAFIIGYHQQWPVNKTLSV